MDATSYRNSGEQSDITVIVDNEEFHLEKFPLAIRSDYFRNLTQLKTHINEDGSQTKTVTLHNFPGGPSVFSIVADYCYNKEIRINESNVIETICAAEYLKMTNGLSMIANNLLFDLTFLSRTRSKRDYKLTLGFVEKAAQFVEIIEACGVYKKLIDALVEGLVAHVKASGIYESINIYSKVKKEKEMVRHELVIDENELKVFCGLPVKWIVDIVKGSLRFGLNHGLVGYLVQNYVDKNTGLILSETEDEDLSQDSNNLNLVMMTGDILKLAQKTDRLDKSESSNLIQVANEILKPNNKPESENLNLIKMAGDILKFADKVEDPESEDSNLIQIVGEIIKPNNSTKDEVKETANLNLIKMAGDILKFTDKVDDEEESQKENLNLIKVAGDILEDKRGAENSYSNLSDGDDHNDKVSDNDEATPESLKSIMSAVLLLGGEGKYSNEELVFLILLVKEP